MRKRNIIILLIILASFIIGVCLYPKMPAEMASHWNMKGNVDSFVSRFWGLFLMPFISLGLFLLFLLISKIDPLKENIGKFRKYFDRFILLIIVFLVYIYLLSIFWNLGFRFDMGRAIIPVLGTLFFYSGILIENAKRNWFIGIRTPWTLSNERVWEKTHEIGGKLFKIAGAIAFLGFILPKYAVFFILIPIIIVTVYTIVYSYFEYQKETNKPS